MLLDIINTDVAVLRLYKLPDTANSDHCAVKARQSEAAQRT